jgi:hypothetical protein
MGPLGLGYLPFRFVASNSVTLLKFPDELIALPFNHLPIIVRQSTPGVLCLSDELFSVSFELIAVDLRPSAQLMPLCQQRQYVRVPSLGTLLGRPPHSLSTASRAGRR